MSSIDNISIPSLNDDTCSKRFKLKMNLTSEFAHYLLSICCWDRFNIKFDGGRVCLVLIISLPGLTSGVSVYDARVTAVVARFSSLDNMTHICWHFAKLKYFTSDQSDLLVITYSSKLRRLCKTKRTHNKRSRCLVGFKIGIVF